MSVPEADSLAHLEDRIRRAVELVAQLRAERDAAVAEPLPSGQVLIAEQTGESLNDIASSQGVSQTDLTNAIKQGIQQAQPAGAAPLSDTQLTNIANRVAGHHHHHHGARSYSKRARHLEQP